MDSRNVHSSLEKNFQTQSTFRRNSRYFNAPQISTNEHIQQMMRRKPVQPGDETIQLKMDKSFNASTVALSERVNIEIEKYTSRQNFVQIVSPRSTYEKQYISPLSPKLKSFSIQKMLSRDKVQKIKVKVQKDQRLFNNFKLGVHDLSKTCDFSKMRNRSLDFKHKHINDLYYETKKPYEYCNYDTNISHSKTNYKIQNKHKQRYFFIKKREEDFPATILDPQKVDLGLKVASNFKGSNLRQDKIAPFYLTPGKQLPSQSDNRYMTRITNFYRNKEEKMVKPQTDYRVEKIKQSMDNKTAQSLKKPKRPVFNRSQMCNQKFFSEQLRLMNKKQQK